ncbi:MAG: SGNH/GDSL hydrolase family protein [Verrucomicrobiaceae bacterium]|nr:SGNH/GDSL hydrolase family protein [Verrucomicrobiaceae bacterium]
MKPLDVTMSRVSGALTVVFGMLLGFPLLPTALRWPARVAVLCALAWLAFALVRGLRRVKWSAKGVVFSGVLLALMFAATHLLCFVFMKVMGARDDRLALRGELTLTPGGREQAERLVAGGVGEGGFHPRIGWVPHAGQTMPGTTVSKQGIRATREYPAVPLERDKRVLCMGDSFTFGVGVTDGQTYPHHAEELKPGWEWLNFGIPGACLTQACLHYMENARKFDGKYVVIGFMTNDAQRTVNCYRPFVNRTSGMAMTKPFAFIDDAGNFDIKPNPYTSIDDYRRLLADPTAELRALLRQDYLTWGRGGRQVVLENPVVRTFLYAGNQLRIPVKLEALLNNSVPVRPLFKMLAAGDLYGDEFWAEDSKGFRALCGMFDFFHSTVIKDGRIPLIAIIPGPHDIDDFKRGDPRQYETLLRFLKQRGYRHLDFLDTLLAKHRDDLSEQALFVVRHYQGQVNRELAQEIVKALQLP